jgi:LAGLIDADG-like domain
MATAKTLHALDPPEAAYIAGLIDGEGTITLTREHRGENRRLVVSISSTERVLLEFVAIRCGCGKITNKRTSSDRHAPSFAYRITNRQALDLLREIYPFLVSYKRLRAELALADYARLTPRNGKYSAGQKRTRDIFERKLLSIRKAG